MPATTKPHPYDGFFPSGRPKKTRSTLEETDYEEIFRGAGCSIPVLDLPEVEPAVPKRHGNSSQLDYSNIFSSSIEVAVPLEELLLRKAKSEESHQRKVSRDSNKSRDSSNSEQKQESTNGSLDESIRSAQQFNVPVGSTRPFVSEMKQEKVSSNRSLDESTGSAQQSNAPVCSTKFILSEVQQKQVSSNGSLDESIGSAQQLNVPAGSAKFVFSEVQQKEISLSESMDDSISATRQINAPLSRAKSILCEGKPKQKSSSGSLDMFFDGAKQSIAPHCGSKSSLSEQKQKQVSLNESRDESIGSSAHQISAPVCSTNSIQCEQKPNHKSSNGALDQSFDGANQLIGSHGSRGPSFSDQNQESSSGSAYMCNDSSKLKVGSEKSSFSDRNDETLTEPLDQSFADAKQFNSLYDRGKSGFPEQKLNSSSVSLNKFLDSTKQSNTQYGSRSIAGDVGIVPGEKLRKINHATSLEDEILVPPMPELNKLAAKLDWNDVHHLNKSNIVSGMQNFPKECGSSPEVMVSRCQTSPCRPTSHDMFEVFSHGTDVMGSSSSLGTKPKSWIFDDSSSEPVGLKSEKSQGNISEPGTGSHSPIFSDEEIDEHSAALASSVKRALDEAQATLKFAKELMVRKKGERFQSIKKSINNDRKCASNVENCSSTENESEELNEEIREKLFYNIPYKWSKMDKLQDVGVFGKGSTVGRSDKWPAATSNQDVDKEGLQSLAEKDVTSSSSTTTGVENVVRLTNEIPSGCENMLNSNTTLEDKYTSANVSQEKLGDLADSKQRTFTSEINYVPSTFQWNFDAKTFKSCEDPEPETDDEWQIRNALDSEDSIQFHDVMHEFDQELELTYNSRTDIELERDEGYVNTILSNHANSLDMPESLSISNTNGANKDRSEHHVPVEIDEGATQDASMGERDRQNERPAGHNIYSEAVESTRKVESPNREIVDNLKDTPIYRCGKNKVMKIETISDLNVEDFGSNHILEQMDSMTRDGVVGCCQSHKLETQGDTSYVTETRQLDRKDDILMNMYEQVDSGCRQNEDEKLKEVDEGEWYEETLEGITITAELKEPDEENCRAHVCYVESKSEEGVSSNTDENIREHDESGTNSRTEINERDQDAGLDVDREKGNVEQAKVCELDHSDGDDENSEVSFDEVLSERELADNSEETDDENGESETCSDGKEEIEIADSEMEDCMNDEFDADSVHEKEESSRSSDERWTTTQIQFETAEGPSFSDSTCTEESASDTSSQNFTGNNNHLNTYEGKANSEFEEGSADTEKVKEKELERMQRIVVERAIKEARERAFAEARERAGRVAKGPARPLTQDKSADEAKLKSERAAVERATADVRERALEKMMADAANAKTKASADQNLRSSTGHRNNSGVDKASMEAQIKSGRSAVERATADARERAFEKMRSEKGTSSSRPKSTSERKFSASTDWIPSETDFPDHGQKTYYSSASSGQPSTSDNTIFPADELSEANNASTLWKKAAMEKDQRTAERAAKALAEKNMRDLLAQKEQAERHRLAETLDAEVKRWSSGKEKNLCALLSTLQYILGPESGWQPIPLTDLVSSTAVKKAYRKATLFVHPDKLQQRGASIQRKYTCEKVFDLLKEAWNKFNAEQK